MNKHALQFSYGLLWLWFNGQLCAQEVIGCHGRLMGIRIAQSKNLRFEFCKPRARDFFKVFLKKLNKKCSNLTWKVKYGIALLLAQE